MPPSSPDLTTMAFYFFFLTQLTVQRKDYEPLDTTNSLNNARYPTECVARAEIWYYVGANNGAQVELRLTKKNVFICQICGVFQCQHCSFVYSF